MKISVVTATWNSAATVADTLASINAQTHPDVEQIIVDGGSTDATLDIVEAKGQRVAAVLSERDEGIYDAMNKGLKLARGEVVGLLNSDDFLASPDVLAKIAEAFADPSVDAVYGDLCYVRQNMPSQIVRYWHSGPFRSGSFARGWAPPHPTLYVRRELFDRVGGFDLAYSLAADFELMVRLFEVHRVRVRYLPMVMVRMRMGGASNKSLRNIVHQNREIWRALHHHGLAGPMLGWFVHKALLRGRQFLSRPAKS
ncbi:MAG: glycosyltransferase family 2 protein [Caldimonas sp.]